MDYFRKILQDASKSYDVTVVLTDEDFYNDDASVREDENILNIKRTTITYFIKKHLLSQLTEIQQNNLNKKYTALFRAEQINENGSTKRMFTNFIDKLIGCSMRCLKAKYNGNKEALSEYLAYPQDLNTVDEEVFYMNKFVYENVNVENLSKLVYDRYMQGDSITIISNAKKDEKELSEVKNIMHDKLEKGDSLSNVKDTLIAKDLKEEIGKRISKQTNRWYPDADTKPVVEKDSKKRKRSKGKKANKDMLLPTTTGGLDNSDDDSSTSSDAKFNKKLKKKKLIKKNYLIK